MTKAISRLAVFCCCYFGFTFTSIAVISIAVPSIAVAEVPIKEGLQYRKLTTPSSQTIHILEINPQKFTILPKHAKGQALGVDTLSTLAKENNAIAAINGGFFHMSEGREGLPAGILKIKGQWYGIAYTNRAAVGWWENKPSVLMNRLQTKTTLKIKKYSFPINAVNQPGSMDRAVLYTDAFGKYTNSAPGGKDIIIQNNRITKIVASGQTEIPQNGYVYAMGSKLQHPFYTPAPKDNVKLDIQVIPETRTKHTTELWQNIDNIVGGTPLLIENGTIVIDGSHKRMQSAFATKRHARTAFGVLNSGSWIWVVVEKNKTNESVGMTLVELAQFMKEQGCIQALNLDGGSSSAMYLENKLVSTPTDELEEAPVAIPMIRHIADAILILDKNK